MAAEDTRLRRMEPRASECHASAKHLEAALRDHPGWLGVRLAGPTFSEALEPLWHNVEGRNQRLRNTGKLAYVCHEGPAHARPHAVPRVGSEDTLC